VNKQPRPSKRAATLGMVGRNCWSPPFQLVAEPLSDADLRCCNLEYAVSDRVRNLHHLYSPGT